MHNKILILGKLPPPIGGVTIHVKRLLERIDTSNLAYKFFENTNNILELIKTVKRFRILHLHSSNPYYRLLVVIIGRICLTKTIITVHGDLGRFKSTLKNLIDNMAITLCTLPIVLNEGSYIKARKLNAKSKIISAFIPPVKRTSLPKSIEIKVSSFLENYKLTFATNAFNRTIDKNGEEIYGIEMLIPLFAKFSDYALIISDPSGAYSDRFKNQKIILTPNIFIINYPHSYFEILDRVDVSIRNTSTDGDPLSIKESLYLGTPVIASNIVSRHPDCIIYTRNNLNVEFIDLIDQLKHKSKSSIEDGSLALIKIYSELL